jgi:hypothetical protein
MKKAWIVLSIAAMFLSRSNWASTEEWNGGLALRQNVLLMQWPSLPTPIAPPAQSFGVSGTALRGWTGVKKGGFTVSLALESRASFSSTGGSLSRGESIFGKGSPLERFDWTSSQIDEPSASLFTRLENLSVAWNGSLDIEAGRQPVTLGTSHFISVLDVIAPFAPGDLDATYKPGVDAIRIRSGLGAAGEAEIIGAGTKPWNKGALLGRLRSSLHGMDVEAVGGRFRNRGFGGVGWDGQVRSAGVWGELAIFERKSSLEKYYGGWKKAAVSGIAGIDLFFPHDTRIGAAFLHQDFGVRHPGELLTVNSDSPFKEGWLFLGSARYGLLTLHRQFHPLVNADLAGIVNMIDRSTLWQPRITLSVSDNADLSIYGWISEGSKPSLIASPPNVPPIEIRSEFGMLPSGAGLYARWFF